jgi:hypothetical protein
MRKNPTQGFSYVYTGRDGHSDINMGPRPKAAILRFAAPTRRQNSSINIGSALSETQRVSPRTATDQAQRQTVAEFISLEARFSGEDFNSI